MIRRPPRSTQAKTPFPTRRSSDLINGSGCCVFQYGNVLDRVRIQSIEVCFFTNNAVDDVSRICIVGCIDATDRDRGRYTRHTGFIVRENTRHTSCHRIGDIGNRDCRNVICRNSGDRTGQVHFLLRTVTDHDHFIQLLCIFRQCDIQVALSCNFYKTSIVTDKRNL